MVRFAPRAALAGSLALAALLGAGCSKSEPTSSTTTTAPSTTATATTGTGAGGTVTKAEFLASLQDGGLGPEVGECVVAEFDQNEVAYPPATGGTDEQEELLDTATNDCVQDIVDAETP